jgi:AcrR family transcriptional regulator
MGAGERQADGRPASPSRRCAAGRYIERIPFSNAIGQDGGMTTGAAEGLGPGWPRDPDVDQRVVVAAVGLFGEAGWAGFSIEAVARRAGVGKASIYLRWRSREELLAEALRLQIGDIAQADTGSLRSDLVELARQFLELYSGPAGQAVLRLPVEAHRIPGLRERQAALSESQRLAARAIVRRGIDRGELPAGTSVTMLLDTLCGGAMFHAMTAQPGTRGKVRSTAGTYAERLVDFLLTAVTAG